MDSSHSHVPAQPWTADESPELATLSLTSMFQPSDLRLQSRQTMLALSYLIEDQALLSPDTVLLAAFQRFSYFMPQFSRYEALSRNIRHAYVFGLADCELPALPNVTYVPLDPRSPLLHEWVVLAFGPALEAGLFARDLRAQQPRERSERFAGLWTADIAMLDHLGARLEQALHAPLLPSRRDESAIHRAGREIQRTLPQRLRMRGRARPAQAG